MIWHGLISVLSKASIAAWVLGGAPRFAHVPLSRCFNLGGSLPLAVGHLAMASDRGRLEAFQGPRPAATPFIGSIIAKAQLRTRSHAQQSFGRQLTKGWQGASTQTYSHHGAPTKQPKKGCELVPSISKSCSSMILMVAHMNIGKKLCKVSSIKGKLWVGVLNWHCLARDIGTLFQNYMANVIWFKVSFLFMSSNSWTYVKWWHIGPTDQRASLPLFVDSWN